MNDVIKEDGVTRRDSKRRRERADGANGENAKKGKRRKGKQRKGKRNEGSTQCQTYVETPFSRKIG